MSTDEPQMTDEPETNSSRRMDPELRAMSAIIRTLDELDSTSCCRIVAYINSRYRDADSR